MRSGLITMLTDFGEMDPYVGICKGVIMGVNPQASIVDLVHSVKCQSVLQASFLLATCVDWFPRGTVHMAVVDPTVGTERKAIAIQGERHFYVGPDNGIFTLALRRDKPVGIVQLGLGPWTFGRGSRTFQGRDVFAPAAAHLSKGVSLENLGPALDDYETLDMCSNIIKTSKIKTTVVHIDRYGNLVTLLHQSEVRKPLMSVKMGDETIPVRQTFAEVPEGELLAYWGSADYLEIAVNCGSAKDKLNANLGDLVEVRLGR